MKQTNINPIGVFLWLLFMAVVISAQVPRGVGVRVKGSNGQTTDVKLYDGSFALVIGESDYTNGWDSLPGVKTDVAEIKRALQKDFTVETEINLTSDALKARINRFISDYGFERNNRLLIYFAGHGHTQTALDGRDLGYIIPSDAPLPDKDALGFRRKAISMDAVQNYARQIEAKHALFVFDSCFSGKLLTREMVKVPAVIREDVTFPVRQFITAGAANQSVPDESIFRKVFVRALEGEADLNKDGYVTGTEIATFLKDKVTNASDGAQTPQYGKIRDIDLERGDFVFVLRIKTAPGKPSGEPNFGTAANAEEIEREAFLSIQNSNDANEIRAVLDEYPSSKYAKSAKIKLDRLTWESVKNSNDKNRIQSYLDQFPKGQYAAAARIELKKLTKTTVQSQTQVASQQTTGNSAKIAKNTVGDYPQQSGETGKFGYMDDEGKQTYVLPPLWDVARRFTEGLAAVGLGGKFGYIDKKGDLIIPLQFDYALEFSDGLAVVGIGGDKFGYVNKSGKVVIPLQYRLATTFENGKAMVGFKGRQYYIDVNGNEIK